MALFFDTTPENCRQQIAQINFILANPLHPIAKLFLSYWSIEQLKWRRTVMQSAIELQQTA